LPEVFGVITAADPQTPEALRRANGLPGSLLGDALRIKGWRHFAADVVLPGSDGPRVSFAVIENLSKLERLMRDFIHPGIFWVQRGEVLQTFLGLQEPKPLGPWDRFTDRPPTQLHATGNLTLLDQAATAFLCSTKCPGDRILEAYDWARQQCDQGRTIISGFHTPVEKDVLAILARRGANIIWVPARDLPKTLDAVFKAPMDEGRLLILTPFPYGKPSRPTKESSSQRNHFVLARTPNHYIPHCAPDSSLTVALKSIEP
jgi:hypothetical protein